MIEFLQYSNYIIAIPAIVSFLLLAGYLVDFSWGNEYNNFFTMCRHHKILKIASPILILSFLYIFTSAEIIYSLSRNEIRDKLNDKSTTLKINDEFITNENIITDFKNIKRRKGYERISGNTELRVEINDMKFRLIKDFSRDSVFLVYYENYYSTSANPIGKLMSNSLKNYYGNN